MCGRRTNVRACARAVVLACTLLQVPALHAAAACTPAWHCLCCPFCDYPHVLCGHTLRCIPAPPPAPPISPTYTVLLLLLCRSCPSPLCRRWFYTLLSFLHSGGSRDVRVAGAFLWSVGSFDVAAVHPISSSHEGSYADPAIIGWMTRLSSAAAAT